PVVLPEQRGDLGDREHDDEVEEPLRPRDAFALDDLRHGKQGRQQQPLRHRRRDQPECVKGSQAVGRRPAAAITICTDRTLAAEFGFPPDAPGCSSTSAPPRRPCCWPPTPSMWALA